MKIVPIYLNHYSVVSSMKSMAEEQGVDTMSEARIRDMLARKFETSYVKHVSSRDIQIERGRGLQLIAEYEVREDLIGNLDAVISFKRVQPLN
jgi:helix-turn-helix protein